MVALTLHGCAGLPRDAGTNANGAAIPDSGSPFDDSVTILRNTGGDSHMFELVIEGSNRAGPRFLKVADLNGDDLPDLVAANLYSATVSVLLNEGNGRLGRGKEYPVGENPTHVTVDDFNGDGAPDIAVANSFSDTVSVLFNQSDGTFADAVDYEVSGTPTFVTSKDLDGDGDVDLATANAISGTVAVLINLGDGTFEQVEDVGAGRLVNSLLFDDLDGDGIVDLVMSSVFDRQLTIILLGRESFATHQVGLWPLALKAGDLNGDGSLDLATANALDNSVSVLLNDGQGRFGPVVHSAVGEYPGSIDVVDLDGDGALDLATANRDGDSVSVLLNTGNGTFRAATSLPVGRSPNALVAADLNGDGAVDLATPNSGSDTVSVLLNDGNGGFQAATSYPSGQAPRRLEAADLDQDGLLDLLVTGYMTPPLPAPTASSAGNIGLRTSVPAPRVWSTDFVLESYARVGSLDGLICLPERVEWWHATDGMFRSTVFQDRQWQTILAQRTGSGFFIQLDPYFPPRIGPLSSRLPPELAGQTFASPGVRDAFKAEALARVRWYNPQYVCLGMEINAYFEQQPDDFENYLSLFIETRELIKEVNPDAVVFVSFQYEQLLGRFGGLAGQIVHEPDWLLFEIFEPFQDAAAISSYPLVSLAPQRFSDPSLVPGDYYSRIAEHTDLPIIFSELGWSPDPQFNGSPENQTEFLRRFAEELTRGLDVLLVNYFFLSDTKGFGPFFDSLGLIDRQGQPKEAFHVWNAL